MLNLTPSGIKLTPTGVKINTNLVWTSHNTGGVEFNTGVFAVYCYTIVVVFKIRLIVKCEYCTQDYRDCAILYASEAFSMTMECVVSRMKMPQARDCAFSVIYRKHIYLRSPADGNAYKGTKGVVTVPWPTNIPRLANTRSLHCSWHHQARDVIRVCHALSNCTSFLFQ